MLYLDQEGPRPDAVVLTRDIKILGTPLHVALNVTLARQELVELGIAKGIQPDVAQKFANDTSFYLTSPPHLSVLKHGLAGINLQDGTDPFCILNLEKVAQTISHEPLLEPSDEEKRHRYHQLLHDILSEELDHLSFFMSPERLQEIMLEYKRSMRSARRTQRNGIITSTLGIATAVGSFFVNQPVTQTISSILGQVMIVGGAILLVGAETFFTNKQSAEQHARAHVEKNHTMIDPNKQSPLTVTMIS